MRSDCESPIIVLSILLLLIGTTAAAEDLKCARRGKAVQKPQEFDLSKSTNGVQFICIEPISVRDISGSLSNLRDAFFQEAAVRIHCDAKGSFDAQMASQHSSLGDWIFSLDDTSLEQNAMEKLNAQEKWWSTGLSRCPLPEGLTEDPNTCFLYASPVGKTCIGVKLIDSHATECKATCTIQPAKYNPFPLGNVRIPRFLIFFAACALFYLSPTLADSVGFHYSMGVSLGVLASLMIIVYILSRSFSGRWSKAFVLVLGLTGNLSYIAYLAVNGPWYDIGFWQNYWQVTLMYIGTAAALSFGATYWMLNRNGVGSNGVAQGGDSVATAISGPGRTLLRYTLRLVALMMAFQSSSTVAGSLLSCVVVVLWVPILSQISEWTSYLMGLGDYYVPPKPKKCYQRAGWIDDDTYELQKERTTNSEMRKLCSSPGFQRWMRNNIHRVRITPHDGGEWGD